MKMKIYAVWLLAVFFLCVINIIPRYIGGFFCSVYRCIVEYILIAIMADKFTDWVFGNKKGNGND